MDEFAIGKRDQNERPTWKLLAWYGAGFVIGLILFGGFTLYAAYHSPT